MYVYPQRTPAVSGKKLHTQISLHPYAARILKIAARIRICVRHSTKTEKLFARIGARAA
jgi:hypothetical protein